MCSLQSRPDRFVVATVLIMAAAAAGSSSASLGGAAPLRVYRILHLTDIHFTVRPTWRECWAEPKRFLGLFNHTVLGRGSEFSRPVQRQLVGEVFRHQPTHVVVSGDLTSFASDSEYEQAYDALKPILHPPAQPYQLDTSAQQQPAFSSTSRRGHELEHTTTASVASATASPCLPSSDSPADSPDSVVGSSSSFRTVVIAGNHDVYTFGSVRSRLFDRWFGHWRLPTARILSAAPDLHFVAIDACQPNSISSHGHVEQQQVSRIALALHCVHSYSHPPSHALSGVRVDINRETE